MHKFLEGRYDKNKETIERIAHSIATDQDFTSIMSFCVDIYESAYLKAIEDCKEQFDKLGIKVEIAGKVR